MSPSPALSRRWIREVDRRAIDDYGMLGLVLMENAARGAVEVLLSLGCRGPVVIFCGKGNNAGDGFAMARHLDSRHVPVKVLLCSDPAALLGDAAANLAILENAHISRAVFADGYDTAQLERELDGAEWIVDALLGTGSRGDPRSPLDQIIPQLNRHSARRLAVDLPSGLDCDSGSAAATTFRADHTVTFVAPKPGLLLTAAQPYVGQLHVVDIGVPRILLEEIFRDALNDMAAKPQA